jgi:hypothetical protein
MFVDEASALVVRTDGQALLPGQGLVGVRTDYEDFRDVGGMRVPFRSVAAFDSRMIERVVTTLDEAETGFSVPDETFAASGPSSDE